MKLSSTGMLIIIAVSTILTFFTSGCENVPKDPYQAKLYHLRKDIAYHDRRVRVSRGMKKDGRIMLLEFRDEQLQLIKLRVKLARLEKDRQKLIRELGVQVKVYENLIRAMIIHEKHKLINHVAVLNARSELAQTKYELATLKKAPNIRECLQDLVKKQEEFVAEMKKLRKEKKITDGELMVAEDDLKIWRKDLAKYPPPPSKTRKLPLKQGASLD